MKSQTRRTMPMPPNAIETKRTFKTVKRTTINYGMKVVLYGDYGIGKSTLAFLIGGDVAFIDLDRGTTGLQDVIVFDPPPATFTELRDCVLQSITILPPGGTLVIDKATSIDFLIVEEIKRENNFSSIKQLGYDRFPVTAERFKLLLTDCDKVAASGRNIIFTADAAVYVTKTADGFDHRVEAPALPHATTGSCRDALAGWCDHLFYIGYEEQTTREITDRLGKGTGVGKIINPTTTRTITTDGTPTLKAKSRLLAGGRRLPAIVPYSGPADDTIWSLLKTPELIDIMFPIANAGGK
jgi:hypothetical protein